MKTSLKPCATDSRRRRLISGGGQTGRQAVHEQTGDADATQSSQSMFGNAAGRFFARRRNVD